MTTESLTLRKVAEVVGGTVEGDGSFVVVGLQPLDEAGPNDLTFADAAHAGGLSASRAGAVLLEPDTEPCGQAVVRVASVPRAVYQLLCHLAKAEDRPAAGVHPTATVDPTARLGTDVTVGPGAVIGAGAIVGDRTVIGALAFVGRNVVVGCDVVLAEGSAVRFDCVLGDRVRLGTNSVIGYDGFGYHTTPDGVHHRIPHVGNAVIEDDVEIGACSCVDRAKFGSTRIGRGVKIDNLVQVAHNCQIGAGSILVAQVGVAGSVKLGRYCVLGGKAAVRDNITLGNGVQIAACSAVAQDYPDGEKVAGTPALPAREAFRIIQSWPRLPDLIKKVRHLESRLEALESSQTDNH